MKTADIPASEVNSWSKSQTDGRHPTSSAGTTTNSLNRSIEDAKSGSWDEQASVAHVLHLEQICLELNVDTR